MDSTVLLTYYDNPEFSDFQVQYRDGDVTRTIYCHRVVVLSASDLIRTMVRDAGGNAADLTAAPYDPVTITTVFRRMYGGAPESFPDTSRSGTITPIVKCIDFADYLGAPQLISHYVGVYVAYKGTQNCNEVVAAYRLAVRIKNNELKISTVRFIMYYRDWATCEVFHKLINSIADIIETYNANPNNDGKLSQVDEFMIYYRLRHTDPELFAHYYLQMRFEYIGFESLGKLLNLEGVTSNTILKNIFTCLRSVRKESVYAYGIIPIRETYVASADSNP